MNIEFDRMISLSFVFSNMHYSWMMFQSINYIKAASKNFQILQLVIQRITLFYYLFRSCHSA